jgi:proteic killer suppression protein
VRGAAERGVAAAMRVRGKKHLALYRFPVYDINMIRSFRDAETEKIFRQQSSKKFQSIEKTAIRKLFQIHHAVTLQDLSALPGNRLEKLEGDRKGQYSIRINDQFRVCFIWEGTDALDVEITDYH